ncbi:extensin [Streptomyces parvulus]|uniref:extensin n=1 Tax=Streptomyces parvulus TaxID=146923 RepID=UPI0036924F58
MQRAPARTAVPLRRPAAPGTTATAVPLPVAPLAPPPPAAPHPPLPVHTQPAPARAAETTTTTATTSAAAPPVQRAFGLGRARGAISSLASHAAAAVAETFPDRRSSSQHRPAGQPSPSDPSPPYSEAGSPAGDGAELPGYTAIPEGGLDPRQLTDFQLDELVHRIIGRVTRLVRTELRMDRERIGRLRDPR